MIRESAAGQVAYGHMVREGEHILVSQPILAPSKGPMQAPYLEASSPSISLYALL